MVAPKVFILWDLETAFLANRDAADIVAGLRRLGLSAKGGPIRNITAYWNSRTAGSRDAQGLQAYLTALKNQGIDNVDTSFLQGDECTVKAMTGRRPLTPVDMFLRIIDGNNSPVVLIISNNPSMQYPIAQLTNRMHKAQLIGTGQLEAAIERAVALNQAAMAEQGTHGHESSLNDEAKYNLNETGGPAGPSNLTDPHNAGSSPVTPTGSTQNESSFVASGSITYPQPRQRFQSAHPCFAPLIHVLALASDQGDPKVLKPRLGNLLMEQSHSVYTDAGVNNFKKYIELAEKRGIIETGGGGVGAWVALKGELDEENGLPEA